MSIIRQITQKITKAKDFDGPLIEGFLHYDPDTGKFAIAPVDTSGFAKLDEPNSFVGTQTIKLQPGQTSNALEIVNSSEATLAWINAGGGAQFTGNVVTTGSFILSPGNVSLASNGDLNNVGGNLRLYSSAIGGLQLRTSTVVNSAGEAGPNNIPFIVRGSPQQSEPLLSLQNNSGTPLAYIAGNGTIVGAAGITSGSSYVIAGATALNYGGSNIKLASTGNIRWGSAGSIDYAADAGLERAAPATIKVTDGATGHGAIQTNVVDLVGSNAKVTFNSVTLSQDASGGPLRIVSPYALATYMQSQQVGQQVQFSAQTAEGKLAGFTHYDVANAKGRLLEINSDPAVAISFAPSSVELLRLNGFGGAADATSVANWVITTPTPTGKPLVLRGVPSQAAPLLELQNSSNISLIKVTPIGSIIVNGDLGAGIMMSYDGTALRGMIGVNNGLGFLNASGEYSLSSIFATSGRSWGLGATGQFCWSATTGNSAAAVDTGLARSAAGVVKVTNAGSELGNLETKGYKIASGTADPTNTDIADGFEITWKNTTTGEIRRWVNDGGVMRSSAAYT